MTRVVADASVTVKWIQPFKGDEINTDRALNLFARVGQGDVILHQPPHWLAEVVAVIARLSPETAQDDISDLYELEFQEIESEAIYLAAYDLSRRLNHHLFDTLYHAVALQLSDALLITADERYYRKARKYGNIALLADYDARH